MKVSAIILLVAGLLAVVSAFSAVDDLDQEGLSVEESPPPPVKEGRALRVKRVTCDLLSVNLPWGSLNHSACAAHCLSMRKGFKGGRCKDGVCHCRK